MAEILSIIFDASIGMDINPNFCFTSQGLNSYVRKEKEKTSWGHVSEFGFDMFVRCYERMWVSYYVGDLLRFSVGIRFHFPNPIGRSLN